MSPIVAVNHCEHAIWLHGLNHPETLHLPEDVFDVVPKVAARGRKIDLLWMSPDCTHFSRAKGGKPRETGRRSLADVAINWARDVRPSVIMLENVAEFLTWGPLDDTGHPIKERAGESFHEWRRKLEAFGYRIEWRILAACDYGAPTSRKRLYLVARCDGRPFRWPEPTHGPGRAKPWRTAAECIDWSIPCRSIFDRKKPLAEATQRRIAAGLVRFVLNNPRPYIVNLTHGGRLESADEPLKTITCAHRGEKAIIVPTLVQTGYGEREGQAPRALDIEQPIGTVVAGGQKHGLVAPVLTKFYGTSTGSDVGDPCPTVTATGQHLGVVAASLMSCYGQSVGQVVDAPCPSVTAGGQGHTALIGAWLAKHYTGATGQDLVDPLGTVTGIDHHSACEATLSPVESAGARRVACWLLKYYSTGSGQKLDAPMDTITTLDRFGLVTVTIEGEPYVTDIGMRMLQPRELARAMGFADSYRLEGTKEQQVARIGNAVAPPVARAIVPSMMGTVHQ